MDNKAQGAAEIILLLGGMIIIVLIALFFYRNYLSDFSSEIINNEVNNFNFELNKMEDYFN